MTTFLLLYGVMLPDQDMSGVLVVKFEGEPSMRLTWFCAKVYKKSKSIIFDKTNKTDHQTFSLVTKYTR